MDEHHQETMQEREFKTREEDSSGIGVLQKHVLLAGFSF
jgi:hypothetical protein